MKEKYETLIATLQKHPGWINAENLSNLLGVSKRTLRRYISEINALETYIISSSKGYKITDNIMPNLDSSDDNPDKRRKAIFSNLLLTGDSLDIFDLAEEYYTSEATILKDINQLRQEYSPHNIKISIRKNLIRLETDEQNRRNFMKRMFYEESEENYFDLEIISTAFGLSNISTIKNIIIDVLNQNKLFLNEYLVTSILIHISIVLNRVESSHFIDEFSETTKATTEYIAAKSIIDGINNHSSIQIPENEIYYLAFIISTKTTVIDFTNVNEGNFQNFIDNYYIDLTLSIADKIYNTYHINLKNEDFIIKFSIHLKHLIERVKGDIKIQNPLTQEIKSTYPLIYNLSVFIAYEIQKEINKEIDEEEITFISFHVGSYLERAKYMESKIDCVVICPQYYSMQDQLVTKLKQELGHQIEIVKLVSSITNNIESLEESLIISTIPLKIKRNYIKISAFLNNDDLYNLKQEISNIAERKENFIFKEYFEMFFNEELFFYTEQSFTKNQAIEFLGKKMIEKEYMDSDYLNSIFEREDMSSTAFTKHIAMPHAMNQNAFKSAFGVLISKSGIIWDNKSRVNIVILTAMSKKDRSSFLPIFDSVVQRLSLTKYIANIITATNYDTFKNRLTNT